jgi:hypothetical protein
MVVTIMAIWLFADSELSQSQLKAWSEEDLDAAE